LLIKVPGCHGIQNIINPLDGSTTASWRLIMLVKRSQDDPVRQKRMLSIALGGVPNIH
jgi:hypothetical protein